MSESTLPHPENFCGGAFQDWLEVNLTNKCNARCSWCIEKLGFHPDHIATWEQLAQAAISTGKKNIILLGGEPTLYPDIKPLIEKLVANQLKVWVTTNGCRINPGYCKENFQGIAGVNISIHHFDMRLNHDITHLYLNTQVLEQGIKTIHELGGSIRFNCNTIRGYIDSENTIREYITFAKTLGADSVRFAELKVDENNFVNLTEVLNGKYGLNDDPFINGCHKEAIIDGMPVNFRQMCGLQTNCRPAPHNPKQHSKQVLYYDGKIYAGWQSSMYKLSDAALDELLQSVSKGKTSAEEAKRLLVNF